MWKQMFELVVSRVLCESEPERVCVALRLAMGDRGLRAEIDGPGPRRELPFFVSAYATTGAANS